MAPRNIDFFAGHNIPECSSRTRVYCLLFFILKREGFRDGENGGREDRKQREEKMEFSQSELYERNTDVNDGISYRNLPPGVQNRSGEGYCKRSKVGQC